MIANARYTADPHFYLILFLFLLLTSCKVQKPSSPNHLLIKVIENDTEVTKEVERTKVGLLDPGTLEKVNLVLTSLNSNYPEPKYYLQHIKDIDHFTYYIQNPNSLSPTIQN